MSFGANLDFSVTLHTSLYWLDRELRLIDSFCKGSLSSGYLVGSVPGKGLKGRRSLGSSLEELTICWDHALRRFGMASSGRRRTYNVEFARPLCFLNISLLLL